MAYLVYKHKSYYAVFSINRKRKWIKIGRVDKKVARKTLKKLEIEYLKGKLDIKDIKPILLFDFLEEYLPYCKTNKAANTYRLEMGIATTLKSFLGNVLLTTIDNKTIEEYKSFRVSKGLKPNSTNRELMIIRVMMKKALEWSFLHKVPTFKLLKIPKTPVNFLSVEEIDRLIDNASIWLKPILVVLRNTGMRIGELLNLRFEDIDLEKRIILVRSVKTNNYRVVPINAELSMTLEWLSRHYTNPKSLKCLSGTLTRRNIYSA